MNAPALRIANWLGLVADDTDPTLGRRKRFAKVVFGILATCVAICFIALLRIAVSPSASASNDGADVGGAEQAVRRVKHVVEQVAEHRELVATSMKVATSSMKTTRRGRGMRIK